MIYDAYEYTVEEAAVTGYTASAATGDATSGFTITNSPTTTGITVTKAWAGDTDYTSYRPASLRTASSGMLIHAGRLRAS